METFLIKALQLLLSLSILVIVHEFGHFIFARIFKIRVEKFYLFFDPWFSLFKFKPKNSDTEYGVGWLPLGGYVKISGMIDESMDKDQMSQPAKPWEFRSKPAWQRLLVMVAGVLFNFILAIFILSMIVFSWGDEYVPYKNFKDGMNFSEKVEQVGFRDGDVLVSADGKELRLYNGILGSNSIMAFFDADEVQIERNGQLMNIAIPEGFGDNILDKTEPAIAFRLFEEAFPTVIDSVLPNSEASRLGLMAGDSLVSINDSTYAEFADFRAKLLRSKNDSINLVYFRNGQADTVTAKIDTAGTLGFYPFINAPEKVVDRYGFFESFPVGIKKGAETLKAYVSQSRFIFSKEGAKNVGGFGAIGKMFPAQWDWKLFWTMTAFLSIALGFLNILPIPALDGGHIVFLLYEVITRRKPNERFMEYAQIVGMFLLLALILYANGNDILRALFG